MYILEITIAAFHIQSAQLCKWSEWMSNETYSESQHLQFAMPGKILSFLPSINTAVCVCVCRRGRSYDEQISDIERNLIQTSASWKKMLFAHSIYFIHLHAAFDCYIPHTLYTSFFLHLLDFSVLLFVLSVLYAIGGLRYDFPSYYSEKVNVKRSYRKVHSNFTISSRVSPVCLNKSVKSCAQLQSLKIWSESARHFLLLSYQYKFWLLIFFLLSKFIEFNPISPCFSR